MSIKINLFCSLTHQAELGNRHSQTGVWERAKPYKSSDCWRYQQQHAGLRLYDYVVLENHLHFIAQADNLNKCVSSFKSYTARQIIDHLEAHRVERLLARLRFTKLAHRTDRKYQIESSRSHAPAWECSEDAPRLAPQRGAKAFPRRAWERD